MWKDQDLLNNPKKRAYIFEIAWVSHIKYASQTKFIFQNGLLLPSSNQIWTYNQSEREVTWGLM